MYLKLLTALTISFLSLTFLVMAKTAPQTIAWNQQMVVKPILMHAQCPDLELINVALKRHI